MSTKISDPENVEIKPLILSIPDTPTLTRSSSSYQERTAEETANSNLEKLVIVGSPPNSICRKWKGLALIGTFVALSLVIAVSVIMTNGVTSGPVKKEDPSFGVTTISRSTVLGYFGEQCHSDASYIPTAVSETTRVVTWNLEGWAASSSIAYTQGVVLATLDADFIVTQENIWVFQVLNGLGSNFCFVGEGRDDHSCPCPNEVPLTSDAGGEQEHVAIYWNTDRWAPIDTATVFMGQFKYARIYTRGSFRSRLSTHVIKNPNSQLCLDVDSGSTNDGANIHLSECDGSGAQKWYWSGTSLINVNSGKCLDTDGDYTGANIHQWECNNGPHQNWEWQENNKILRSTAYGLCVDVLGAGTAAGTNIQLYECNDSGAQDWYLTNEAAEEITLISIHLPTRKQAASQEICIQYFVDYVAPLVSTGKIILIGDWNVEEDNVWDRMSPLLNNGLSDTSDWHCSNCANCHEGFDKAYTNMVITSAQCNQSAIFDGLSDHWPVIVEVKPQ